MSSLFDSEVYAARRRFEHAEISLPQFMRDAMYNEPCPSAEPDVHDGAVILTLHHRGSVSTREWWTLSWIDQKGHRREVQSQEFNLLLWRAECVYRRVAEIIRFEDNPRHPWTGHADEFQNGSGI
jgi:hypothetical protein